MSTRSPETCRVDAKPAVRTTEKAVWFANRNLVLGTDPRSRYASQQRNHDGQPGAKPITTVSQTPTCPRRLGVPRTGVAANARKLAIKRRPIRNNPEGLCDALELAGTALCEYRLLQDYGSSATVGYKNQRADKINKMMAIYAPKANLDDIGALANFEQENIKRFNKQMTASRVGRLFSIPETPWIDAIDEAAKRLDVPFISLLGSVNNFVLCNMYSFKLNNMQILAKNCEWRWLAIIISRDLNDIERVFKNPEELPLKTRLQKTIKSVQRKYFELYEISPQAPSYKVLQSDWEPHWKINLYAEKKQKKLEKKQQKLDKKKMLEERRIQEESTPSRHISNTYLGKQSTMLSVASNL